MYGIEFVLSISRIKWNNENRPSFLDTMTTQLAPTVKMSMFRDICTGTLTNWQAVDTLRATNIQLLIDVLDCLS